MYSEWSSLVDNIRDKESNSLDNVLKAYPTNVGKEVVKLVLKALRESIIKELPVGDTVTLTTHQQVEWSMGVIGYGLSLPLTEHNLMHICIDTYEIWLSVVYDAKTTSPGPVREEPDLYVQVMFRQLCQVFNERPETVPSTGPSSNSNVQLMLENQALLCNRVLRMWHNAVIQSTTKMSRESWDCLLHSLLRVTNLVLAPPIEPNSLAMNLKSLPVHVLFEAWLLASVHAFPRPQLWKSLCELCRHWRHHRYLANQWTKLIYALTFKVIGHLYTANYLQEIEPSPIRLDQSFLVIVEQMSYDIMVQCWYRILHILGDPVELAYPKGIANLPAFKKYASEREEGQRYRPPQLAPTQASLAALPLIYHELMRGVATLIYLFLGRDVMWDEWESGEDGGGGVVRGKAGLQRNNSKDSKGQQGGASRHKSGQTSWYVHSLLSAASPRTPPSATSTHSPSAGIARETFRTTTDLFTVVGEISKPQGNTLLQLFGSWLFRAAIWPDDEKLHVDSNHRSSMSVLISSLPDLTNSLASIQKVSHDPEYLLRYEKGRAEAFGALCSIFSSQHCREPFLPIYLARFYHALILGLHYSPETSHGHILTEIMLHSYGLLRKDLKGINIVVPYFLDALELILPRLSPPFKWVVDLQELRCASIDLLLSMISLPLHFLNQPLPNVFTTIPDLQTSVPTHSRSSFSERGEEPLTPEKEKEPLTFLSLKDHLVQLLLSAIEHERGHTNKQVLLHALNVVICDIVVYDSAVSKLAAEDTTEDYEMSNILQDQAGGNTRSDMCTHTQHSSEYSPSMLVNKAIAICETCLNPPEGEDTSVQVSLAALELLSSVARLPPDTCNHSDSRHAVLLVSGFIESQAMKAFPRHNRDLHTSIVAAFSTLTTFILAHPYLMGSKETMSCVMKVIELGISGCFSKNVDGTVTYKGHKKAKPISGRVKEIAEFMLYLVMENIYAFPSPCGAESSSSLLSEDDILARLRPEQKDKAKFQYFLLDNSVLLGLLEEPFTNPDDDDGNDGHTSPLPTVTAVIRSPSGKHVWSMQLRHHPRSYQPSTDHRRSARRPVPKPPLVPSSSLKRKPWPDEVNFGPSLKLDLSLPSLDDILDSNTRAFHEKMLELTSKQVQAEERMHEDFYKRIDSLPFPNPKTAVEPPLIPEKFNTARLFLNHLSLLGIEGVKEVSGRCQPLVMLNSSHPKFAKSLTALDSLPSRFCSTIFVLHCKVGVTKPEDILASHSSLSNKPAEFLAFLHNLGWMVDPAHHPGFAGKIHPPKMESASSSSSFAYPVGISAQIPARPFPYYTDSVTELAFIVPKLNQVVGDSSASLRSAESSDSGQDLAPSGFQVQGTVPISTQQNKLHPSSPMPHSLAPGTPPGYRPPGHDSPSFRPLAMSSTTPSTPTTPSATYMNMDLLTSKTTPMGSGVCESSATAEGYSNYSGLPSHQRKKQLGKSEYYLGGVSVGEPARRKLPHQDCAAMIVWLERFEDHHTFPVAVLSRLFHSESPSCPSSHKSPCGTRGTLPVIFIHKMASGLYQIMTKNSGGRLDTLAGPLTDGMVVSRRSLNILARQTVINMCHRYRMENDGFSPPHVKRKRKLEEMAHTYKQSLTVADFYAQLLTNNKS